MSVKLERCSTTEMLDVLRRDGCRARTLMHSRYIALNRTEKKLAQGLTNTQEEEEEASATTSCG